MLRGRASPQAAFDLVSIFYSKQQRSCATEQQESSEAAADAPSVKGCGLDRTKGHDFAGVVRMGAAYPLL